jgi:hypothetical protein
MREYKHDPVWYRDVRVLWQHPLEFFPSRDQSPEERVNSIVRLLAYAGAAVFAYSRKSKYLLLALAAVTAVTLAYRALPPEPPRYRPAGGQDDDEAGMVGNYSRRRTTGVTPRGVTHGPARGTLSTRSTTGATRGSTASGRGGGSARGSGQARSRGSSCQMSSPNNPFANVLLTDYADNPDRAPACDYDVMKKEIRRNFNRGLIRDAHDVFEKENSQRQYFSMPVTTTYPDTKSFAEYAYGTKVGCKENPAACTGNF